RNGYFRQTIDADGHQEHRYPDYDLVRMPLTRALGREGNPLTVSVELPERTVHVDVWTVQVGRVPVLLLDTDNPINDPADRPITHILYVRGREMRLHQELILGVGGVRALRALAIQPDVTAFSLRLTNGANAVSKLHAVTANATWREIVPHEILAITNGVHPPTWVGGPVLGLFERYLDADLDDLDGTTAATRWWERI